MQEEKVRVAKVDESGTSTSAIMGIDNDTISFSTANDYLYTITRDKEPHAIFRKWRRLGTRTYAYLLEGLSDFPSRRYAASMPNIEDVGFREPNKNVNLHKLRRKLRSKKKMKELLLRYFRS